MTKDIVATSKILSLVFRHRPHVITLDAESWVPVEDLLAACGQHGRAISREQHWTSSSASRGVGHSL
jgi:RNA:NAD 2'-phosphotransferase (TPT1/KptA family)